MTYKPRHSIIGVEIDGCDFTTDTEFLPWVHKQTTEGIERYQPCVVHGVKINGVWFDACAMGDDFIEEMEYEIQRMPLNADGDIDEAAIRMGKAVMAKRAAETARPEPVNVKMLSALRKVWSEGVIPDAYADLQDEVCNAIAAAEEAQPAPAQAVPLTRKQLVEGWHTDHAAHNSEYAVDWFLAGARFAERAHGITGEPKHG